MLGPHQQQQPQQPQQQNQRHPTQLRAQPPRQPQSRQATTVQARPSHSNLDHRQLSQDRKAIDLYITRHYDPDTRMLNLTNLSGRLPEVKLIDFNQKRFAILLESIMALSCPDVLTLVLNNNNISTLSAVAVLLQPRLKVANISLDSNKISNFDELSALKNAKLRELVLTNNPVCAGQSDSDYIVEVVRRLPELSLLNMKQIKAVAENSITTLPPAKGDFMDSADRAGFVNGFVKKYFEALDGDRKQLINAYADTACFSLSHTPTNTDRPNGSSSKPTKLSAYSELNRNLSTIDSLESRTSTLKVGAMEIVESLATLPQTKHDFESFTVDAFLAPVGSLEILNVYVQGSFTELPTQTKLSFSRVFLLTPDPKHAEWPAIIVNDQLYIRTFTPKRASSPSPQPPSPTEPVNKQEMINKLMAETRMNVVFAEACMAKNNWDYARAFANFAGLMERNEIPAEAFVH